MSEPFYITTAISYPNGPPHIGHAYEAIAADAMARFQRQQGRDVRFQTGTDEHGLKMAQAARGEGVEPRAFADKMSRLFQEMCDTLNVSYDRFIRTSQPDHYRASQAIWKAMEERGDLYLDRYEGWYSVRDEAYYEEENSASPRTGGSVAARHAGRVDGRGELVLPFVQIPAAAARPLCGESRLHPTGEPAQRGHPLRRRGPQGPQHLADQLRLGRPGAWQRNHVMYVWLDALTNYITGLGYPDDTDLWRRYWPANVHLIGKDVVRFHAVYWPAFLMSAGIALPKQVYGHGFLLSRGEKMSKSVGNVVDPMVLAERFGVDALRYFLLREVTFGQDGSYSAEAIVTRANAELANSFGNLAQRVLTADRPAIAAGCLPEFTAMTTPTISYSTSSAGLSARACPRHTRISPFRSAAESWIQAVFACNAYIDEQAPWALRKTDPERMETVLATLYICIAILASDSPDHSGERRPVARCMGVAPELRIFGHPRAIGIRLWRRAIPAAQPTPLFPRLELEEEPERRHEADR